MYKLIIRPLLFTISPEIVHHIIVSLLKLSFRIPRFKQLIGAFFSINNSEMSVDFIGMKFKNPVGLAAGFDKNASFYNEFSAFGFSFIEVGTVTPKPQPGNPKPRSFRLPKDKALINRMGFNNIGVEEVVKNLKKTRQKGLIIGGNIGKNTLTPNDKAVDDYVECFVKLYEFVDYFVVNVSCPNINDLKELQDQDNLEAILEALIKERSTQSIKKPILLKISPDLNNKQLDEVIVIFNKTRIDGLVVSNTTIQRKGLITNKNKIEKIGEGGLSGQPMKERSTEMIQYINHKSNGKIPIIGVGGIMNANDAIEKIKAGAKLLQVYTGFIYEGPGIVKRINKRIKNVNNLSLRK